MLPLSSLLADLALEPSVLTGVDVHGVDADSRRLQSGDVFFALPGTKVHGINYVHKAEAVGVAAVVVDATAGELPLISCPVVRVADVRLAYAKAVARFYPVQFSCVAAVTGTNGKTSVSVFLRQIWEAMGYRAASLGTVGVVAQGYEKPLGMTTPDAKVLHEQLLALQAHGVTHLALEASSHGLEQRRLDGLPLSVAGFTNFTRDHLDYHGTMEAYRASKLRLFDTLMMPRQPAVICADGAGADAFLLAAEKRGLQVFSVGALGTNLTLFEAEPAGFGTRMVLDYEGSKVVVHLPLAGTFQVENALVAAGMALTTGAEPLAVFRALETLKGAKGRLEPAGSLRGGMVVVDYAHTPDALEQALLALRPYVDGRLYVVFGCGGDRDPGKRPLMGKVAATHSDFVIVTDDNPRTEEASRIREQVRVGAPDALDVPDRRAAIAEGLSRLHAGDVLLVAGKGHETGQIIGDQVLPFSDQDVIAELIHDLGGSV